MLPTDPPLWTLAAGFALCAAGIWRAGTVLTLAADGLAERHRLARSLMGLVLLATATSLPEIVTTLFGAARGAAELVVGNLFGGIALQTAILALADLAVRGPITSAPRRANHALEATLLVSLLGLTLVAILLGEPVAPLGVGLGSIAIGLAYAGAILLLRRYDGADDWVPVDLPDEAAPATPASAEGDPLARRAALSCAAILLLGLAIVWISETLAARLGIGAGLMGATLLAGATSLPELSTTIAAVRAGAHTLAISNVFGSNLIMLVLVLPADALYRPGPILAAAGDVAALAICFGLIATGAFLSGLIVRRKPVIGRLGLDSVLVLATFVLSLGAYWIAG